MVLCRGINIEATTTNCKLLKQCGLNPEFLTCQSDRRKETREGWREWFSIKRSNNRLPLFHLYFLCSVAFICLRVHDTKTCSFSCVCVHTPISGHPAVFYLNNVCMYLFSLHCEDQMSSKWLVNRETSDTVEQFCWPPQGKQHINHTKVCVCLCIPRQLFSDRSALFFLYSLLRHFMQIAVTRNTLSDIFFHFQMSETNFTRIFTDMTRSVSDSWCAA